MTHVDLGFYASAVGGVALVAFGLFVLSQRPRQSTGTWLALFAIGLGGHTAASQASVIFHWSSLLHSGARIPFALLWITATCGLGFRFPSAIEPHERKSLYQATTIAALLLAVHLVWRLGIPDRTLLEEARDVAGALGWHALYWFLFLLVLRFYRSSDVTFRRQAALAAVGPTLVLAFIAVWGTYLGGQGSVVHAAGPRLAYVASSTLVMFGVAAVWLASTRGPSSHVPRNMAWLTLATMLGALVTVVTKRSEGTGVMTAAMALFLAYAVLRKQFLGVGVKVRFALSRSTIAAAFIAVFFIASEAAQQFFGETLGSTYVGIVAAGMLVFAMAPLQRAAERLAERAVPLPAQPPADRSESSYREAVRLALRDRTVTSGERVHLHRLAENLGIRRARAAEILHEVEHEQSCHRPGHEAIEEDRS